MNSFEKCFCNKYELNGWSAPIGHCQTFCISNTSIPFSKVKILLDCLKKIANEDFRGNRPKAVVDAFNALKEFEK